MAASKPDVMGIKIHTYTLIEEVGQGQFGLVCKAEKTKGTNFAIKRVMYSGTQASVRPKIEKMTKLNQHNHVIRVHEIFFHQEQNRMYIVMDYMNTVNINDLMINKNVPHDHRLAFMIEMAQGLNFLHNNNITHGDLRPPNILLRPTEGRPKCVLTDYGFFPLLADTETSNKVREIAEYFRAPEAVNSNKYSPAGDIYSLGEVYYTIWTVAQTAREGKKFLIPAAKVGSDAYTLSVLVKNGGLAKVIRSDFTDCPQLLPLIDSMVQWGPDGRPSAETVMAGVAEAKGAFKGGKPAATSVNVDNLLQLMQNLMQKD